MRGRLTSRNNLTLIALFALAFIGALFYREQATDLLPSPRARVVAIPQVRSQALQKVASPKLLSKVTEAGVPTMLLATSSPPRSPKRRFPSANRFAWPPRTKTRTLPGAPRSDDDLMRNED